MKSLRWKNGKVRGWKIDGRGDLHCAYDSDYKPQYRVRGRSGKFYKQVQVMVSNASRWLYVHRLMAFSWFDVPENPLLFIVDHRNSDSLCNHVENLRWVTITGNNLNKKCDGLVEKNGLFAPRVAGFTHTKYASPDRETAKMARNLLVECYVRFNTRFPDCGSSFPHSSIYRF